jgi:hexokinase
MCNAKFVQCTFKITLIIANIQHSGSRVVIVCRRFEKLFAGHYVGDLVRLVLLKLAEDGLIFGGKVSEQLRVWGAVTSSHVSDVER